MREPILTGKALARYWAKVDKRGDDECWPWTRSLSAGKDGYGHLNINQVIFDSHRLTWALVYGEIPDGLCVLHKCNFKPCCNPKHLYLGTKADNMADLKATGHNFAINACLTDEQVRSLREEVKSGVPQNKLAYRLRMDPTAFSRMIRGKTYKHVV